LFILAQFPGYPLPGGRGWERKLYSFTAVVHLCEGWEWRRCCVSSLSQRALGVCFFITIRLDIYPRIKLVTYASFSSRNL